MATPPKSRLWIWGLFLAVFYAAWLWIVFANGRWEIVKAHWPIALTMILGSYVAGSTPIGGGAIAFPVMALIFGMPATLGRDFSFAIQAAGMTSATIFILCRRQPLATGILKGALLGAAVGTPIGILWLAPLVPQLWIKLIFATAWCAFGILHLYRTNEFAAQTGLREPGHSLRLGFFLGLLSSATLASITGVGVELALYAALVLFCRADLKIAIPTAVIGMAFTSVIGLAVKLLSTGLQPGVFENWLAAAPIVVLGAPIGAFVVSKIGRKPTLRVVAVLCVLQYVWMCYSLRASLGLLGIIATTLSVAAAVFALEKARAA